MEYTRLGETGLEVSKLCLGCMNFGSDEPWMLDDREASVDLIHRALDAVDRRLAVVEHPWLPAPEVHAAETELRHQIGRAHV